MKFDSNTFGRVATIAVIVLCVRYAGAQFAHLTFQSEPGDFIGGGQTQDIIYTPVFGGFFSASATRFLQSGEPTAVTFSMGLGETGKPFASLNFSTSGLDFPLQPGQYTDAQRFPFEELGHPGMSFAFNGAGCNTLTGNFTVHEFTYSASLGIQNFSVSFEQHCEGMLPALFGTFTYNAVPEPSASGLLAIYFLMGLVDRAKSRRKLPNTFSPVGSRGQG